MPRASLEAIARLPVQWPIDEAESYTRDLTQMIAVLIVSLYRAHPRLPEVKHANFLVWEGGIHRSF